MSVSPHVSLRCTQLRRLRRSLLARRALALHLRCWDTFTALLRRRQESLALARVFHSQRLADRTIKTLVAWYRLAAASKRRTFAATAVSRAHAHRLSRRTFGTWRRRALAAVDFRLQWQLVVALHRINCQRHAMRTWWTHVAVARRDRAALRRAVKHRLFTLCKRAFTAWVVAGERSRALHLSCRLADRIRVDTLQRRCVGSWRALAVVGAGRRGAAAVKYEAVCLRGARTVMLAWKLAAVAARQQKRLVATCSKLYAMRCMGVSRGPCCMILIIDGAEDDAAVDVDVYR